MDDARLPVWLSDGRVVYISDLWTWPHALLSGTEKRFLIYENEIKESLKANGVNNVLFIDISKEDGCQESLSKLKEEMERRYKVLDDDGSRDIWAYNAAHNDDAIPPILVFVHDSDFIAAIFVPDAPKKFQRIFLPSIVSLNIIPLAILVPLGII